MKITKKDLMVMLKRLCRAMNTEIYDGNNKGLNLDYAACYGGYVIEEIDCNGHGVSHPFGCGRRSPREIYYAMNMTACALEDYKFQELYKHKL